jgi:hypothetical protein
VVALYGLLDTADKGRRAYDRAAASRDQQRSALAAGASPAASLVACLAAAQQQQPLQPPAGAGLLTLAALSAAASPRHSAAQAVGACGACLLQPPPAYHAPSAAERQSLAVPVAAAVLDTALWHTAASLVIPGVVINRTVWAARHLLDCPAAVARLHPRMRQLAPSVAGLLCLPLVVHRIDDAVNHWMAAHLRSHMPEVCCACWCCCLNAPLRG